MKRQIEMLQEELTQLRERPQIPDSSLMNAINEHGRKAEESSPSISFPKFSLDDGNYVAFEAGVHIALQGCNAKALLKKKEMPTKAEDGSNELEMKAWKIRVQKDAMLFTNLCKGIQKTAKTLLADLLSVAALEQYEGNLIHTAMSKLKEALDKHNLYRAETLQAELTYLKFNCDRTTFDAHIAKVRTLQQRLIPCKIIGTRTLQSEAYELMRTFRKDKNCTNTTCGHLEAAFDHLQVSMKEEDLNFEAVKSAFFNVYQQKCNKTPGKKSQDKQERKKNKSETLANERGRPKCYNCGMTNHLLLQCRKPLSAEAKKKKAEILESRKKNADQKKKGKQSDKKEKKDEVSMSDLQDALLSLTKTLKQGTTKRTKRSRRHSSSSSSDEETGYVSQDDETFNVEDHTPCKDETKVGLLPTIWNWCFGSGVSSSPIQDDDTSNISQH